MNPHVHAPSAPFDETGADAIGSRVATYRGTGRFLPAQHMTRRRDLLPGRRDAGA